MADRFGVIPMHPGTLLDEEQLEAIVGGYLRALEDSGGRRWAADDPPDTEAPIFLLVATGGSERVILDWWTGRPMDAADQPLWLIAHPGNNSLPAALEVMARLQHDGETGRIFYLEAPDDPSGLRAIEDAAHDLWTRRALQRDRIGLVGEPSDWLVASSPGAAVVKAAWGPTVVPIGMDEVVGAMDGIPDSEIEPYAAALVDGASEVREPSPADLREVARLYLALRHVVADRGLDALTVRCFDFVLQQKTTGCFALAQLTDDGVTSGCEGDLVSTVGLLWARHLLDETPWMANPAQLDPHGNTLWLAHCTVPRALVRDYRLRSHFESGLGVGIQGSLPPGPVTLLRIGGRAMDRVWLAEGEILRDGDADNLCRTQAEIRLGAGGQVTDLLRAPLGNHLVMVRGRHLGRLRQWCADYGFAITRRE